MKYFSLTLVSILFLSSCITSTHINYSDPNYLKSNEFNTYEELIANYQGSSSDESSLDSNNYYTTDNDYDYSFSSRLRRFHGPMYNGGYYGGIYTNYAWYDNDPFLFGRSIYYGYNCHSPYYSYYSYSPYYLDYYTPYYYGSYYSYNYGYKYNQNFNNTYYNNNKNHNSYITGRRGSLSSNNSKTRVKSNTNRLPNLIKDQSNSNIRINNQKTNRSKTSTIRNNNTNKSRKNTSIRTNSNRRNNIYSTPKNNNRNYNSKNRNNRSNNRNKSSRGGRANMKPRR